MNFNIRSPRNVKYCESPSVKGKNENTKNAALLSVTNSTLIAQLLYRTASLQYASVLTLPKEPPSLLTELLGAAGSI